MDIFRIKKFRNTDECSNAENKIKELGVSVVLSDACELYVPTGDIEKALDALALPPEIRNAPQPGPWCLECGHQLVSKKGNFGRFFWLKDISGLVSWRYPSPHSWYCHNCDSEKSETNNKSAVTRLKKRIKRTLVKIGYYSKPAFIIIGAQKAGTTALFRILQQHPQIIAPKEKELRFFDDNIRIKYGDFVSYHEEFPLPYRLYPNRLTFEASPSYLFNPVCPKRIYKYAPEIRLIVILREPISRAFSAWKMNKRFALSANPLLRSLAEHRSFEEAIKQEVEELETTAWERHLNAYVKRGIYIEQLEKYLQYFPRNSLLILEHSHLLREQQAVFSSVFRFLQIEDQVTIKTLHANVSTDDEELPKEARDILNPIYKPYNERLFSLLGRDYDW